MTYKTKGRPQSENIERVYLKQKVQRVGPKKRSIRQGIDETLARNKVYPYLKEDASVGEGLQYGKKVYPYNRTARKSNPVMTQPQGPTTRNTKLAAAKVKLRKGLKTISEAEKNAQNKINVAKSFAKVNKGK